MVDLIISSLFVIFNIYEKYFCHNKTFVYFLLFFLKVSDEKLDGYV